MAGKTELLHGPDEPLGGIVLVPLDGISVVHGELVVEVMVALSNSCQRGDDMVARSMLVVKGRVSEPVSERVDAEC